MRPQSAHRTIGLTKSNNNQLAAKQRVSTACRQTSVKKKQLMAQKEESIEQANIFRTAAPVRSSAGFPPRQQARQLKASKTNPSST